MALTDFTGSFLRARWLGAPAQLRAWLASDHGAAQRMAGMAFMIRVLAAGIVFLSQIALARWMGSAEFGIYVAVWTWLLVAGDTVHLCLPHTAQRFIPEYTHNNALSKLRGFLVGSRWLTFSLASAFALAGAIIIQALSSWLDSRMVLPFYLACVSLPFYSLSLMCDGQARSYNWIGLALAPHSILRPAILFTLMAIAHFAGFPVDAFTTMIALAVAIWCTSLLQLVLVNRRLAQIVPDGPKEYQIRRWFRTSLPITLVWVFYTLLCYTDVLVLQWLQPPTEVAHYYAAAKTISLVGFIHFSVSAAVAHRYTALYVAGDRSGLIEFVTKSVQWTFWPSFGATLVMLAFGKPILWLFGSDFTAGYWLMPLLAIGLMARAAVGPAERLLNMLDRQRHCAGIYAMAFSTNIGLCLALIPGFGGLGAAIATSAAMVVESALLYTTAKRELGLHLFIWQPTTGSQR